MNALDSSVHLLSLREAVRRVPRCALLHLQEFCSDVAFIAQQVSLHLTMQSPNSVQLTKHQRYFAFNYSQWC